MIKAVLFDLDNTLIDFMKLKRMSIESAVDAMIDAGIDIGKEQAVKKLYVIYDDKGIEYKNIFDDFLLEFTGERDYKILAAGIAAYRKARGAYMETYPKVIPVLNELSRKGIKLGVISDAPRLKAWIRLCSIKLQHVFDVVVTSDDTGKLKPAKEPFEMALEKLGLNASEVLFVGDWPERDILGAKNAGMKTCFAKYGGFPVNKEIKADFEIGKFEEILGILK